MENPFTAIANWTANIALHFENSNRDRFNRWSKFLGRKMFLGLITMVLLTGAFMALALGALAMSGVEAMKALGSDLWTGYCLALTGTFTAAAGTNVLEHNSKAKVKIAQAAPGATASTTADEADGADR